MSDEKLSPAYYGDDTGLPLRYDRSLLMNAHVEHRAAATDVAQELARKLGKQIDDALLKAYRMGLGLTVVEEQAPVRVSAYADDTTRIAELRYRFIWSNNYFTSPNATNYSADQIRETVNRALTLGLIKPEQLR